MAISESNAAKSSITFFVSYEGAKNLAIDLSLYAISTYGHLIDTSPIWYCKTKLCLSSLVQGDPLFFIGVTHDLTNQDLVRFSLFGAFGFYEIAGHFDREVHHFVADPVPERVWRRWLEQSQETPRNQLLWNFGGPLPGADFRPPRSG